MPSLSNALIFDIRKISNSKNQAKVKVQAKV
jgi:hypothetical protein